MLSYSNVNLVINNSKFTNNGAFDSGSIYWTEFVNAKVTFINSEFVQNYAYYGGVFKLSKGVLNVENCTFESNFGIEGGIAYISNAQFNFKNVSFRDNIAIKSPLFII